MTVTRKVLRVTGGEKQFSYWLKEHELESKESYIGLNLRAPTAYNWFEVEKEPHQINGDNPRFFFMILIQMSPNRIMH